MDLINVLLIDDEEELISTLVERLEIRGIQAEAVTNGHDALEKMQAYHFPVVVVDLKMPGLGGREVIQVIKELYSDIKIILITGHGKNLSEDQEAEIEGVFDILMKPFSIDQLCYSIHNALNTDGIKDE